MSGPLLHEPLRLRMHTDGSWRRFDTHKTECAALAAADTAGVLSNEPAVRKETPMARGLLDFFPGALAEVAHLSWVATQQHHPGEELHWDKNKSTDEADCIIRHLVDRGKFDTDGVRHSAKVAWRALALLQRELDAER
jgi:hypothetical protein